MASLNFARKTVLYTLIACIFITQTRCVAYQRTSLPVDQVMNDRVLQEKTLKYRFIVTDPQYTYELRNVTISADAVTGTPEILSPELAADIKGTKGYFDEHRDRNVVFFYTPNVLAKTDSSGKITSMDRVSLNRNAIASADGYVVNGGETALRTMGIVGAVFFGFIIFIAAVISAAANSSDDSCLFCSDSNDGTTNNNNSTNDGSSDSGGSSGE